MCFVVFSQLPHLSALITSWGCCEKSIAIICENSSKSVQYSVKVGIYYLLCIISSDNQWSVRSPLPRISIIITLSLCPAWTCLARLLLCNSINCTLPKLHFGFFLSIPPKLITQHFKETEDHRSETLNLLMRGWGCRSPRSRYISRATHSVA